MPRKIPDHRRLRRRLAALAAALFAAAAVAASTLLAPVAGPGDDPPSPWRVVGLPAQTKPFTRFTSVALDGQRVLRVEAASSYGNLVHPLDPQTTAHVLSWRWRLDEPNLQA